MNGNTTLKIFQYAIIDISLSAWPYLQGIVISHLRTNDKAVLYQANHGQHISSLQLCLGMAESHIQENDRTWTLNPQTIAIHHMCVYVLYVYTNILVCIFICILYVYMACLIHSILE